MNVNVEPSVAYWADTDRQIKVSNHYDKKAARQTNAEFELLNAIPFGTLRDAS